MVKRTVLLAPIVVLVLVLSSLAVPQLAGADQGSDNTNTTSSDGGTGSSDSAATSEADQKAAELAKEQAQKLAEQLQQADQKRAEDLKHAQEIQQEQLQHQSEADQQQAKQKDEAFQTACENKRESYKTRLENINEHAQQQAETLGSITQRVEAFAKSNNVTVANYTTLVTQVETQHQLVLSLGNTTKQKAETFDCGTSQGLAQSNLLSFKDALTQEINALQDYKTAVKNLIVAVKTAAGNGGNQ